MKREIIRGDCLEMLDEIKVYYEIARKRIEATPERLI